MNDSVAPSIPVSSDNDESPESCLPASPFPQTFTAYYLVTEDAANSALRHIVDGVIGFDTEFVKHSPTAEEKIIDETIAIVGGSRKSAVLAWHMIELRTNAVFPYAWDTMGLCVIQIARGNAVWVINLRAMRAYPKELKRILEDPAIIKVGVGLLSDVPVVWQDLRSEMSNLVDAGMMTRLWIPNEYRDGPFGSVSMAECSAKILGFSIDKALQVSDWAAPLTREQVKYAGTDAIVSLRLYEQLSLKLETRATIMGRDIPAGWYTFDTRMGEPTRRKRNIYNKVVPWSTKDCPWFFAGKFQGYYP
ncbi:ribonuclease H-like domain-containing protein [Mycena galericulata]|nr:ribonuclease H-like domain-containing protein [Mycena galericulata]